MAKTNVISQTTGLAEFIEVLSDATLIVSTDGTIVKANGQAEKLLGYSREEMLGQSVEMLVPAESRTKHAALRDDFHRNPSIREMGKYVDLIALGKHSQAVPVSIGLSPFTTEDGEHHILTTIRDNTLLHKARVQVEDYIAELSNITETAIDAIISIDITSTILSWNPAATKLFGYTREEAVGQSIGIIIPESLREGHFNGVARISAGGASKIVGQTVEIEGLHKSGKVIPVSLSLSTWISANGRVYGGILRDITERKNAEQKIVEQRDQLLRLSVTDPLTGAFNRRQFTETAEKELSRSKRYKGSCSMVMLDIDNFKAINDKYGHDIGDTALVKTEEVIREIIRQEDSLYRMGGEEFLILSPETNLSAARTLAERIRQAISQIILATKDDDLCFTTSVGISEFLPDDSDVSAALKRADNALYKAKSEGKNRVCQA